LKAGTARSASIGSATSIPHSSPSRSAPVAHQFRPRPHVHETPTQTQPIAHAALRRGARRRPARRGSACRRLRLSPRRAGRARLPGLARALPQPRPCLRARVLDSPALLAPGPSAEPRTRLGRRGSGRGPGRMRARRLAGARVSRPQPESLSMRGGACGGGPAAPACGAEGAAAGASPEGPAGGAAARPRMAMPSAHACQRSGLMGRRVGSRQRASERAPPAALLLAGPPGSAAGGHTAALGGSVGGADGAEVGLPASPGAGEASSGAAGSPASAQSSSLLLSAPLLRATRAPCACSPDASDACSWGACAW